MGGRGLVRLKYVHAFRDRAGRMRYYFRRNGKRKPLPGLPGCSEFMDAYATLLSDRPLRGRSLRSLFAITARRNISLCPLPAVPTIGG
jgi:hypothetical protein